MVVKQLVYLLALAREKHFGQAAQRCHVTQPTLSAAIRQLEEELGVPIVERANRFIGFTPEGERVLDHARRIVADCDAMRQELSEMRQGASGHLRIGAVPTVLPIMALITGPFAKRHPKVSIAILSMTSIEIQKGLDEFTIEAGITYLDNEPLAHVKAAPLYREEYVLLTPLGGTLAGGSLAGRHSVSWAEAAALPLCLLTPDMQNRRIVDAAFRAAGSRPVPEIETNSIINLCSHVSSGRWSAVMPQALLSLFGLPEKAVALPLIDPPVSQVIGLVIADRDPPLPLARALFAQAPALGLGAAIRQRLPLGAPPSPDRSSG
jgi:DNA-binding transcriptional LysR family regulator